MSPQELGVCWQDNSLPLCPHHHPRLTCARGPRVHRVCRRVDRIGAKGLQVGLGGCWRGLGAQGHCRVLVECWGGLGTEGLQGRLRGFWGGLGAEGLQGRLR